MNRGTVPGLDLLLETALDRQVLVEQGDATWTSDRFATEVMAGIETEANPERVARDLPAAVFAYRFDGIPVLLGALDEPAPRAKLLDAMRRYRNQATIARAWLGSAAANLHLFLIGPPGSDESPSWRLVAGEIEADDKICRKLVWLPPSPLTRSAADVFLDGTFLARPWDHGQVISATRLDALRELELPEGWSEIAANAELAPDAVMRALIETEPAGASS